MSEKDVLAIFSWTDQEEIDVVWREMIDFHEILIDLRIDDVERYYPEKKISFIHHKNEFLTNEYQALTNNFSWSSFIAFIFSYSFLKSQI